MDDSPDSPPQVPSSSSNTQPEDTSPTRDKPEDDPAAKKSNKAKKRTKTGCLSTYKAVYPSQLAIRPCSDRESLTPSITSLPKAANQV